MAAPGPGVTGLSPNGFGERTSSTDTTFCRFASRRRVPELTVGNLRPRGGGGWADLSGTCLSFRPCPLRRAGWLTRLWPATVRRFLWRGWSEPLEDSLPLLSSSVTRGVPSSLPVSGSGEGGGTAASARPEHDAAAAGSSAGSPAAGSVVRGTVARLPPASSSIAALDGGTP